MHFIGWNHSCIYSQTLTWFSDYCTNVYELINTLVEKQSNNLRAKYKQLNIIMQGDII